MFVLCIQNHLLHLRLPSYNRHVSRATRLLLKRSMGLETSVKCLVSGGHCPCMPGVQHFSGPGLHHSPSSSSRLSPSCGTCGSGKSLIHCSMVKAERQKGTRGLGIGSGSLAILFRGGLGRTPMAAITSATAWLASLDSSGLLGGEPEAHLFVAVQGRGGHEGLLQALPTSVAGIVMHDDYVVQV